MSHCITLDRIKKGWIFKYAGGVGDNTYFLVYSANSISHSCSMYRINIDIIPSRSFMDYIYKRSPEELKKKSRRASRKQRIKVQKYIDKYSLLNFLT